MWLDLFEIIVHTNSENPLILNSTNSLTSLEFTSQLNSAASSYDAAPFSNSLVFGLDYEPDKMEIEKGQKVELFYSGSKLGVFYVVEFTPPAEDESIAAITAYDLFYNLINRDIIPNFEILDGIDVESYIKQVFKSVGIAEDRILIDDTLAIKTLNYSVCDGQTLANILKEFCLATDAFIFVDADENIRVISKEIQAESYEDELNDDSLYSLDLGIDFDEQPTGLKLTYNRLTVGETEELTKIETTLQPNIMTELLNINLKNPLYIVEQVKTNCLCEVDSIKSSQNILNLYLTSGMSEEVTAEIRVMGRFIKFVESFLEKKEQVENQNLKNVKTQLIQDSESAQTLLNLLYPRLKLKTMTACLMPDNFSIKLCKVFKVSSNVKDLRPVFAYVHGFKFSVVEGDVDLQITLCEMKGVE